MKTLRISIALLLVSAAASAQTANWSLKSPQTSPPAREGHAMAYDTAHGQVVLFGGGAFGPSYASTNDTWVWDGTNWTQMFPQTSPPAREGHAMVYDPVHGQVVMFGGTDVFLGQTMSIVYNDTWVWDGTNWTKKNVGLPPSPRAGHTMVWDAARSQVILFAGDPVDLSNLTPNGELGGNFYDDTWTWDGFNWTQLAPLNSPPARAGHAMAYDAVRQKSVMFGGNSVTDVPLDDTWTWDGTNWTQQGPKMVPLGRVSPVMAFDAAHSQTVMYGGSDTFTDTWVWDGTNWTKEYPELAPNATGGPAVAYDSAHSQTVLFQGYSPGGSNPGTSSTWTWVGGTTPSGGFTCTNDTQPAISSIDSASAYGGYNYYSSGSWLEIKGTNLADPSDPRLTAATNPGQWTAADFNGSNAPTVLDGVSVSINGKPAYVWYLSTGQLNVQAPEDTLTGNSIITVTNCVSTSANFNFPRRAAAPGFLAPSNYSANGTQYMVATFQSDGAYVLNTATGASFGLNSRPAKPGDGIVAYGIGFGDVTPSILPGVIAGVSNSLVNPVTIYFGTTQAQVAYAGLAGGFVGLYEFYITVPAVANGDYQINVQQNGAFLPQTIFLTVHN
jgi:uncharacterized protein (TIGR03437 family)